MGDIPLGEAHDHHVAKGYCHATMKRDGWAKAWCSLKNGHEGLHRAPRMPLSPNHPADLAIPAMGMARAIQ